MKKLTLSILALAVLSACSNEKHPDYFGTFKPKHPSNELWLDASGEPQYMDPNKVADNVSSGMTNNMFLRLVQTQPKTGIIIPDLAKSWDMTKDGREYTFHLREDAVWSDGKPLTASDVEYSWKRLMTPSTASTYSQMADVIEGAREYRTGKGSKEDIKIKSIDEHTLWVRLTKPVPYFLGLIEYAVFAPVPSHVIEKFKAEGKEDLWVRPGNIVVSGPFILVEEEFKQYKVFKKNPRYFNASKVRLDKIKTIMIEDYNANLNAYKTGQHDYSWAASLPTDMLEAVKKFKDYHFDPQVCVYYYQLNTTRKPLDNVKVRKALSLAIDRQSIVTNIARQGQTPLADIVPAGIPGYQGPQTKLFDVDEAKKLLAEAGYPDGKGFPKFTVKFNTSEGHRKIAEAIQQMWKSNLNIQVGIENMEWKSMLEDQNRSNFDALRMAWVADYLDPNTFLSIFLSESTNNHTHWKNKKYDEYIDASDRTMDQKVRFKNFVEAEKILAEEVPMIPVYGYTRSYMKKPFLRGFWSDYQDRHPWKYMWVDERWAKGVPEDSSSTNDEPWTD